MSPVVRVDCIHVGMTCLLIDIYYTKSIVSWLYNISLFTCDDCEIYVAVYYNCVIKYRSIVFCANGYYNHNTRVSCANG